MVIIFDLDGCLANCEHRRYLVDQQGEHPDYYRNPCTSCKNGSYHRIDPQFHKITHKEWEPDWDAFYEACDKDTVIPAVLKLFYAACYHNAEIYIFCDRPESLRENTLKWLNENVYDFSTLRLLLNNHERLRMRHPSNNKNEAELKEQFLNDILCSGKKVHYVIENDQSCIEMYRKKGIFVFNCSQNDEEF